MIRRYQYINTYTGEIVRCTCYAEALRYFQSQPWYKPEHRVMTYKQFKLKEMVLDYGKSI